MLLQWKFLPWVLRTGFFVRNQQLEGYLRFAGDKLGDCHFELIVDIKRALLYQSFFPVVRSEAQVFYAISLKEWNG